MKFSIVTPTYNSERFLVETIESVLSQKGDFDVEYIIVDGKSSDKTLEILRKYKQALQEKTYPLACNSITFTWISERDFGMYDAINKGFARATGDIYAWINADDVYQPDAFREVHTALTLFPDISWIKGITNTIDESGHTIRVGVCTLYRQDFLAMGMYGCEAYFVEQDSVFWRKDLWKEVGSMPKDLLYAGDYWLWIQFAHKTHLILLNLPISCFRKHPTQKSRNIVEYKAEQKKIREKRSALAWKGRLFFGARAHVTTLFPFLEKVFFLLYPILFSCKNPVNYLKNEGGTFVLKKSCAYRV